MLTGFKQFLLRGNVIDLAVAVVIGGAFGAVVAALVKDLLTAGFLRDRLHREWQSIPDRRLHQCGVVVRARLRGHLFLCGRPGQHDGGEATAR